MFIDNINQLLVYLTLAGQIILVIGLFMYIYPKTRPLVIAYLKEHGLKLSFLIVTVATLGSLFYSEIAGFDPCNLCWYQRIFIYPQVFLLGLALIKKEKAIIDYSLLLLGVGFFISLYHNYIYYNNITSSACGVDNIGSCSARYILELGFMSIPLMALTAFVLTGAMLYVYKKTE